MDFIEADGVKKLPPLHAVRRVEKEPNEEAVGTIATEAELNPVTKASLEGARKRAEEIAAAVALPVKRRISRKTTPNVALLVLYGDGRVARRRIIGKSSPCGWVLVGSPVFVE